MTNEIRDEETFDDAAELGKYRIAMKRKLRLLGYPVRNDETNRQLGALLEFYRDNK